MAHGDRTHRHCVTFPAQSTRCAASMPLTSPPPWVRLLLRSLFIFCLCTPDTQAAKGTSVELDASATVEIAPKTSQRPKPPKCFIFTHLQKSGGTTVKQIIKSWQRSRWVIYGSHQWIDGDAWRDSFAEKLTSKKRTVVIGDTAEALRLDPQARDNCTWFTLFRHPIPRLVSAFFFCKLHPIDPLCGSTTMPAEARTDLVAFAKHWGNYGLRQFIFGMVSAGDVLDYVETEPGGNLRKSGGQGKLGWYKISGWCLLKVYLDGKSEHSDPLESEAVMNDMLETVKNLLREHYAAVGILEEFEGTLFLFDAALDMPGLGWQETFNRLGRQNKDTTYQGEEEEALAAAWTNDELKSYIHLDILLYEHAVDVFHEQSRAHGIM